MKNERNTGISFLFIYVAHGRGVAFVEYGLFKEIFPCMKTDFSFFINSLENETPD